MRQPAGSEWMVSVFSSRALSNCTSWIERFQTPNPPQDAFRLGLRLGDEVIHNAHIQRHSDLLDHVEEGQPVGLFGATRSPGELLLRTPTLERHQAPFLSDQEFVLKGGNGVTPAKIRKHGKELENGELELVSLGTKLKNAGLRVGDLLIHIGDGDTSLAKMPAGAQRKTLLESRRTDLDLYFLRHGVVRRGLVGGGGGAGAGADHDEVLQTISNSVAHKHRFAVNGVVPAALGVKLGEGGAVVSVVRGGAGEGAGVREGDRLRSLGQWQNFASLSATKQKTLLESTDGVVDAVFERVSERHNSARDPNAWVRGGER